jgi:hypothetical protein
MENELPFQEKETSDLDIAFDDGTNRFPIPKYYCKCSATD